MPHLRGFPIINTVIFQRKGELQEEENKSVCISLQIKGTSEQKKRGKQEKEKIL